MRTEAIERQREAMESAGLDALLAISPENFTYTTGFVVPSQRLLRWRHAVAVVTRDGRTGLVCVDMEETTVRSHAPGQDIRVWGEFTERSMQVLARLLTDLGLSHGIIGLEMDYLPAGDLLELRDHLPAATFKPAQQIYDRLRQVKTPEEIDLLRRLSQATDQAIGEALGKVRAGMTEMDLAAAVTNSIYARGIDLRLMVVATGERSEYPNVGPTLRVLKRGDLCRLEVFGTTAGYQAGVCRTAVVQEGSPRAERIWKTLVECKRLLLERIKPGASTRALYEAFLQEFGELGLPPISFVGHGIGLHIHEEPYLGKYGDSRLEAGMVLGVEPLVYGYGQGFGLQIKDMVAVTRDGCELLSDQTNTDQLIIIP